MTAAPTARLGKSEDMAGPCVFLASRAGSWLTGQVYGAAGGRDHGFH
jgi:NAD(P)-dependent dehydrogenase (short-subunit alcohol dehydrogenase family)